MIKENEVHLGNGDIAVGNTYSSITFANLKHQMNIGDHVKREYEDLKNVKVIHFETISEVYKLQNLLNTFKCNHEFRVDYKGISLCFDGNDPLGAINVVLRHLKWIIDAYTFLCAC